MVDLLEKENLDKRDEHVGESSCVDILNLVDVLEPVKRWPCSRNLRGHYYLRSEGPWLVSPLKQGMVLVIEGPARGPGFKMDL